MFSRRFAAVLTCVVALGLGSAAAAQAAIYWANGALAVGGNWSMGRANLDGTRAEPEFIMGAKACGGPGCDRGAGYPEGVAVDGQHIYWTNGGGSASYVNTIGRANLDGSDVNEKFIIVGAGRGAQRIAVDANHIYWTEIGGIARANLNGAGVIHGFIPTKHYPEGVAVDGAHIYWAESTTATLRPRAIARANLDGTAVNESFITGVDPEFGGIAVDSVHIYWGDGVGGYPNPGYPNPLRNTIAFASLDGTSLNGTLFGSFRTLPRGLAVEGGQIYWSLGAPFGAIGRANLDGTGVEQTLIAASDPIAIAVDALPVGPLKPSVPARVSKSAALAHGVPVTVSCQTAPCAVKIKALVSRATARQVHLASASGVLVGALNTTIRTRGAARVNVRVTRKARMALRRLPRFTLTVLVTVAPHGAKASALTQLQVLVH
jgi:hypothetical protein